MNTKKQCHLLVRIQTNSRGENVTVYSTAGLLPQHLPKENEYPHEISVTTTVTQSKFEPGICRYLWTCLHRVMDDVV